MPSGTVKWFNDKKGYGFIVPDDGGKDMFVHRTNLLMDGYKTLTDGQRVDFVIGEGRKGPEAMEIRLQEGETQAPPPPSAEPYETSAPETPDASGTSDVSGASEVSEESAQ